MIPSIIPRYNLVQGKNKQPRYHEAASQQLMDAVDHMNALDPDGPQQVKCWVFNNV